MRLYGKLEDCMGYGQQATHMEATMSEQATYSKPVMVITPAEPIRFSVPGLPIAQPRQRHRVIQSAGRAFATNYTPAKAPVNVWKAMIALAARQAYRGPLLTGPVGLTVILKFPVPVSAKRAKHRDVENGVVVYHVGRPDAENCIKALQDALTNVVWADDSQVAVGHWQKIYSIESGVEVEIRTL